MGRKKGSKNLTSTARFYTNDYISLCEKVLLQAKEDKNRPQMWQASLKEDFKRGRNVDLSAMADWVGSYIEQVWKKYKKTAKYKQEVARGKYR